jgi:hypothetical protein
MLVESASAQSIYMTIQNSTTFGVGNQTVPIYSGGTPVFPGYMTAGTSTTASLIATSNSTYYQVNVGGYLGFTHLGCYFTGGITKNSDGTCVSAIHSASASYGSGSSPKCTVTSYSIAPSCNITINYKIAQ